MMKGFRRGSIAIKTLRPEPSSFMPSKVESMHDFSAAGLTGNRRDGKSTFTIKLYADKLTKDQKQRSPLLRLLHCSSW